MSAETAPWPSDEGLRALAAIAGSRPPVAGATAEVTVDITTGRTGHHTYHWSYRDGVPGAGGTGATAEADLALSISSDDAAAVVRGEVEPSVAFMRGRLKASGDGTLVLEWLASTAGDGYETWRTQAQAALG
jgi:hypothetical protein